HMLAISGVSGGSVGAGVFAALVAATKRGPSWRAPQPLVCGPRGELLPCARRVLSADLLTPQLLPTAVGDAFRSIVQSSYLMSYGRSQSVRDRTVVLEQTLERVFTRVTGEAILDQPWNNLWMRKNFEDMPPLIVVNSTSVRGDRVVL